MWTLVTLTSGQTLVTGVDGVSTLALDTIMATPRRRAVIGRRPAICSGVHVVIGCVEETVKGPKEGGAGKVKVERGVAAWPEVLPTFCPMRRIFSTLMSSVGRDQSLTTGGFP